MYRISIVDDSDTDIFMLRTMIEENPEFSKEMEISSFSSGIDFIDSKENSDLLFMDMQMEVMDGFHTAREFRKVSSDTVLCFCSAVISPQTEHFEVLPYRYILKTEDREKIRRTVTELLLEMKRRKVKKTLELVNDGAAFVVPIEDILFLEKQKHGTKVTLSVKSPLYSTDAKISSREKLSDLQEQLKEDGFASPHTSYLVNVKKIISVSGDSVLLENEQKISISRSCKEKFHAEFSKYFSKKYRRGDS